MRSDTLAGHPVIEHHDRSVWSIGYRNLLLFHSFCLTYVMHEVNYCDRPCSASCCVLLLLSMKTKYVMSKESSPTDKREETEVFRPDAVMVDARYTKTMSMPTGAHEDLTKLRGLI